ncbi:ribosome biogenesis protein SLX9-domain-containing protein [Alternaria alternata]|nr:ribosome biogenesis protein SLX9-domain-containing protein [Alternaria alternata]
MAPIKKRTTARAKSARAARPSTAALPKPDGISSLPSSKRDKQKIKHSSFVSKIEKSSAKTQKRRRPNNKLVANLESLADALPDAATAGELETSQARILQPKVKLESMKRKKGAKKRKEKLDKLEKERFNANLAQLIAGQHSRAMYRVTWKPSPSSRSNQVNPYNISPPASHEHPWGERTADSVVLCNASRKPSEGLLPLNHRRLYPPLVLCKTFLPSPKASLSVQSLPIPAPASKQLLIKVSTIGLNAIEAKIAKLAAIPVAYPAILGSSYTGTVEALGSAITNYCIGARVLVSKRFGTTGNQYSAYQSYVLAAAEEKMVVRIPEGSDEAVLASLVMNASCVPGLFSGQLGLRRPAEEIPAVGTEEKKKILIYGGSSSFGQLSVRYLCRAGYAVTTTSSPRHVNRVCELGVDDAVDHTLPSQQVIQELKARGPYEVVVDMISTPQTILITSQVLKAQGGGILYATQPSFAPEDLPDGVQRVFKAWSEPLYEQENERLLEWVIEEYLPFGIQKGWIVAQPVDRVQAGLAGIDGALENLLSNAEGSGKRFVVNV